MQPIRNYSEKQDIYQQLRRHNQFIHENSDIWNWNCNVTLTRPSLARILHLNSIYQLILDVPGDIFEFGSHFGASTAILRNLQSIHEHHNNSRGIHSFDTFTGFSDVHNLLDKSITGRKNSDEDFATYTENYQDILAEILNLHKALDESVSNKNSPHTINTGDITQTLPDFLNERPGALASMIICDVDIFKPTDCILKLMKDRLINGSIIVFDEILHYQQYPGESIALQHSGLLDKLTPIKTNSFVPNAAIFRFNY
ncbi:hypothetical protein N9C98_00100 [Synechococcus sp. AH-224-G16]|nr:hypothetical protein [Synechococcus sp. AH-224-G16]